MEAAVGKWCLCVSESSIECLCEQLCAQQLDAK